MQTTFKAPTLHAAHCNRTRWQQLAAPPRITSSFHQHLTQQHAARLQNLQQHNSRSVQASRLVAKASDDEIKYVEGYIDVEEVLGMRVTIEDEVPKVSYLVKWKDGAPSTWEPAINLSEDLTRDYDERWWNAARKCDEQVLAKMLAGGREVLSQVVDENRRSALHFVAAVGNPTCAKLLIEAGADLNLQDKDGYTPLHMAAGYMRTATMTVLLEAGADPEIKDGTGRDVVSLVDNLRGTMPLSMQTIQARLALEEVANCLTKLLYDEVDPAAILDVRTLEDGSKEFLVQFEDGKDDEWVPEANMSPDVVEDWGNQMEYVDAEELLDMRQEGMQRSFLVKWSDGAPESWEPEEHVSQELVEQLRAQRPELFKKKKKKKQRDIYALPGPRPKKASKSSSNGNGNGNGSSNGGGGAQQAAAAEPVRERVPLFR